MKTQIIEKIISDMSSNTERVNESWYFTLEQVQKYLEANLQPPQWVEELVEWIKSIISFYLIKKDHNYYWALDDILNDLEDLHSIAPTKQEATEKIEEWDCVYVEWGKVSKAVEQEAPSDWIEKCYTKIFNPLLWNIDMKPSEFRKLILDNLPPATNPVKIENNPIHWSKEKIKAFNERLWK